MIGTLFIANRGEIAVRVIRTARRLGMRTVLGVSEADKASLGARLADEAVVLGPASSRDSYLSIDRVIAAAKAAGADAIHPGYGFLSENAAFARAADAAGIIFAGPSPETLDRMGDKLAARAMARAAGLPITPGGEAATADEARERARETGYPLMIKAVSGGGGKGMRRVDDPTALDDAISLAMGEAEVSFGDARVYVERYVPASRHVEVQILGDGTHAIHVGTRDCSIQRRFQKLVEEAPAPNLPDDVRSAIEQAAVSLALSLNYKGAGTAEFLVDSATHAFYFLELNARLQVEHPVTEAISGIDLVEQQLLVAAGAQLSLTQDMVRLTGSAIEVRVNAEDPERDFAPMPGRVARACWPAGTGIRVDSHIHNGAQVPPNYDSLLGKLIVWAPDRLGACDKLAAALASASVEGVPSTLPLHRRIAASPDFRAGGVDSRFLGSL